jgi:hypothetical protein
MKIALTGGIGALSLLLALLLTYGCAPKLIKMEKAELARLHDAGEIQAIHYSPPSPEAFMGDENPQSALHILILPFELRDSHRKSKQVEELSLEDPVLRVKERVVPALATAFDLRVRLVQKPLVEDDLDQLKAALGTGFVIDFKTITWEIVNEKIRYLARSRIVRLENSETLWQGVCQVKDTIPDGSWDELMAATGTLLKVKLKKSAEICAQELLAQLPGSEYFADLSAQAVSGQVRLRRGTATLSPELVKRAPSVTAAWTFYAASRIQYRNDHHLEIPAANSGVKATFEEEVYAREAMMKFWQKVRKEDDRDDYLEQLGKVVFGEFMREYVHVFVVPASKETEISKLGLKDFELFREQYLPGHSAKALATIRAK